MAKDTQPPSGPVLSVRLMDAVFALVVIIAIVAGHQVLFAFSGAITGVVAGLALVYVGYRIWDQHQFRQAELERYRLETRRIPAQAHGNFDAFLAQDGQRIIQAEPGHALPQPVPQTLHYAQHYAPHIAAPRGAELPQQALPQGGEAPAVLGQLALPAPVDLIEVMRRFHLSPESIYLGTGRGGVDLSCSIEDYMHIANDGPSGSGKTTQWKNEMIMLLKADIYTFLANPHFAPISKKGEDWRPIGRALEAQGAPEGFPHLPLLYKEDLIAAFLHWLATVEIDRRFDLQRRGAFTYAPMYGFVDEWPAVVEAFPQAADDMEIVLRRGRAVDVNLSANSQGFLVDDTGLNDTARKNFQTAYWLGGSTNSGAKMLNMKERDLTTMLAKLGDEGIKLGKGTGLVRNNSVAMPAQPVRLGNANNEYTYYMLGRADEWHLPEYRTVSEVVDDRESTQPLQAVNLDNRSQERQSSVTQFFTGSAAPRENVSRNETSGDALNENEQAPNVSSETQLDIKALAAKVDREQRALIERTLKTGLPLRDVARVVRMGSEQYPVFVQVCSELGIDTRKGNPYQARGQRARRA